MYNEDNPQICITETFNFLDVSGNGELSVADLQGLLEFLFTSPL